MPAARPGSRPGLCCSAAAASPYPSPRPGGSALEVRALAGGRRTPGRCRSRDERCAGPAVYSRLLEGSGQTPGTRRIRLQSPRSIAAAQIPVLTWTPAAICHSTAAEPIAERIRLRVSEVDIEEHGAPTRLTCSIGVASSDQLGVRERRWSRGPMRPFTRPNASAAIASKWRFLSRRSTAAQHCCRLPPVGTETRCTSRHRRLDHALLL
jgi:hypothetical protein